MGGLMGAKAVLRITYSNEKIEKLILLELRFDDVHQVLQHIFHLDWVRWQQLTLIGP